MLRQDLLVRLSCDQNHINRLGDAVHARLTRIIQIIKLPTVYKEFNYVTITYATYPCYVLGACVRDMAAKKHYVWIEQKD